MVATGGYLNYLGHLSVIHSGQPWWFNLSVGNFFWDSFSPTNIVLTVSLFLRLNSLNLSRLPHILTNLVTRLAMSSYGIYLVHPFIIDLLDHYANLSVHLVTGNLWEFYLFKVALTFMLSWILVEAIRLLRLANLFFGEK